MDGCVIDTTRALTCRDGRAATHLKLISIFVIFITGMIGISTQVILARVFQGKLSYDKAILLIKCCAAGVILSTSLVHVLTDAFAALSDCHVSSHHPWKDFPFARLVTMIEALLALLVNITATSHVDHDSNNGGGHYKPVGTGEEMKKTSEDRVESGVLASCHKDNSTELVKLKQRLVFTQVIGDNCTELYFFAF